MPVVNLQNDFIYEDQSFNGINQTGFTLEGINFIDSSFKECVFLEAVFDQCTFNRCTFTNCDLSLLKVHRATFSKVVFENSKLLGVDWAAASWHNAAASQLSRSIDFKNCVLNYSSFFGLDLPKTGFIDCTIYEANFAEAKMQNADFSGADLKGSIFRKSDLSGANFRGAKNYLISPTDNTITQATFSLPEAFSLLECLDINIE